jgi:hypothetical protein
MRRRLDSEAVPQRSAPARGAPPRAAGAAARALKQGGGITVHDARALQRAAGNRALARQIPKIALDAIERAQNKPIPDLSARKQAERNPQWAEAKPKQPPPKRRKEYATRSDATSWNALPEALREVLARSWGENPEGRYSVEMSDQARAYLTRVYNRMLDYDLWEHVRYVRGVKAGEKPVDLGFTELRVVGGTTQSLLFEVYDGQALRDKMLDGKTFSKDGTFTGFAHRGQDSLREYTIRTRDGLHLSIGDSTQADAHIDEISPTNPPQGIWTDVDIVKGLQHHWLELWPEYIRAVPNFIVRLPRRVLAWLEDKVRYYGIGKRLRDALVFIPRHLLILAEKAVDLAGAGVVVGHQEPIIKPSDPTLPDDTPYRRDDTVHIIASKTFRFGAGKGRSAGKAKQPPPGQAAVDPRVAEAVKKAVELVDPGVIRPSGTRSQDDFADAETVGQALASALVYRAKYGGPPRIGIDLGRLYHELSEPEVAQVVEQLHRIGKTARIATATGLQDTGNVEAAWKVLQVTKLVSPLGRGLQTIPLK